MPLPGLIDHGLLQRRKFQAFRVDIQQIEVIALDLPGDADRAIGVLRGCRDGIPGLADFILRGACWG